MYAQISKANILQKVQAFKVNIMQNVNKILYVKEVFPELLADNIEKIIKVTNNKGGQKKPRINMTTKELLRKQVIIPMAKLNAELIVNSANTHISNVNKCLNNIKSDIITDFICLTNNGIIITIKKPANTSDLLTIEKYLKDIQNVNLDSIESPQLPKSKSYLKIVGLFHKMEQGILTPDIVEGVLKESHLFEGIILTSKPCVIKMSPKSDMAVVWVDIWDSQSGSSAKNIINCCFNIR